MPTNPTQDALVRNLGGAPGTSNTMPIGAPKIAPMSANMHGFAADNWNNPEMDSVKYAYGRLANGLTKPSEIAALVKSDPFQQRFKGATFDGKDRINFNGAMSDGARGGSPVGVIDVLEGADPTTDSSTGQWWGWDTGGDAAQAGNAAGGAAIGNGMSSQAPVMPGQSDLMAQILASLQGMQQPDPQALLQQQLR